MSDERLTDGDTRPVTAGWLNYPAGIDAPDPRVPMGPNTLGEWLWPVQIECSAECTRIGFSYTRPPTPA